MLQMARNKRIFCKVPLFGAIKRAIKTVRFMEIPCGAGYSEKL
jgi:hypothetical protein